MHLVLSIDHEPRRRRRSPVVTLDGFGGGATTSSELRGQSSEVRGHGAERHSPDSSSVNEPLSDGLAEGGDYCLVGNMTIDVSTSKATPPTPPRPRLQGHASNTSKATPPTPPRPRLQHLQGHASNTSKATPPSPPAHV
ncbi:hypothetical protein EYF80_067907 [Liparis tanakae]|uniref:Uncharacterized protein n=1 Tax=Liparis tanakae TaxID=230148 RepID=A0A4Z2DZJ9_9TELE|nr:hypothetical protein EYF80_067907 [Liparis tanakae]